jgi:hypothetical protein
MERALQRSILAALALVTATSLAGCSSGAVIDQMPSAIGLPAGTPERPTTPYVYPAVHDMPPSRATPTMSEEQQVKEEEELKAVRDRQEARDGAAMSEEQQVKEEEELKAVRDRQEARDGAAKKTAQPAKKKPATADTGQAAGVQDGAKTNP